MNTLATYVDGRSPHFRVWGKERRIPKSVEGVDPSTTDENGLIRARPRTERELRDMHHIRAEARRVFQTIAVAEKMSRALHKQNRKAARHLPRAEEVGKLARYHVGAETTVAKQKRGWYDCQVLGVTRGAYVLRTGNGRIIQGAFWTGNNDTRGGGVCRWMRVGCTTTTGMLCQGQFLGNDKMRPWRDTGTNSGFRVQGLGISFRGEDLGCQQMCLGGLCLIIYLWKIL